MALNPTFASASVNPSQSIGSDASAPQQGALPTGMPQNTGFSGLGGLDINYTAPQEPLVPTIPNFNQSYYQSPQYQSYLNNMPQYGTDDMSPMPFGGYGSSSIGNYQQQSYDDFLKNPSMGQQPNIQEEFGVPNPFMNQGAMPDNQGAMLPDAVRKEMNPDYVIPKYTAQDVQTAMRNPEFDSNYYKNANVLDDQGNPLSMDAKQQLIQPFYNQAQQPSPVLQPPQTMGGLQIPSPSAPNLPTNLPTGWNANPVNALFQGDLPGRLYKQTDGSYLDSSGKPADMNNYQIPQPPPMMQGSLSNLQTAIPTGTTNMATNPLSTYATTPTTGSTPAPNLGVTPGSASSGSFGQGGILPNVTTTQQQVTAAPT
jgi:hypothetical protein